MFVCHFLIFQLFIFILILFNIIVLFLQVHILTLWLSLSFEGGWRIHLSKFTLRHFLLWFSHGCRSGSLKMRSLQELPLE